MVKNVNANIGDRFPNGNGAARLGCGRIETRDVGSHFRRTIEVNEPGVRHSLGEALIQTVWQRLAARKTQSEAGQLRLQICARLEYSAKLRRHDYDPGNLVGNEVEDQ